MTAEGRAATGTKTKNEKRKKINKRATTTLRCRDNEGRGNAVDAADELIARASGAQRGWAGQPAAGPYGNLFQLTFIFAFQVSLENRSLLARPSFKSGYACPACICPSHSLSIYPSRFLARSHAINARAALVSVAWSGPGTMHHIKIIMHLNLPSVAKGYGEGGGGGGGGVIVVCGCQGQQLPHRGRESERERERLWTLETPKTHDLELSFGIDQSISLITDLNDLVALILTPNLQLEQRTENTCKIVQYVQVAQRYDQRRSVECSNLIWIWV